MNDINSNQSSCRNYSNAEYEGIYTLGISYLESGQTKSAENIFKGLTVIKPECILGFFGLLYILLIEEQYSEALLLLEQAKKADIQDNCQYVSTLALFSAIINLNLGDLPNAGTALGEIQESIEKRELTDKNLIKLFKSQLVIYQTKKNSY